MKKAYFIIVFLLLFNSCKKDFFGCKPQKIESKEHLISLERLNANQSFIDILNHNKELQVARIINDDFATIMHCNVFFNNLQVFSNHYMMVQSKRDGKIDIENGIDTTINISLNPTISFNEAIQIAKDSENFEKACLSYQLGITNISQSNVKDYKLVWKISNKENSYPYVILDANLGNIYSSDDGKRN